MRLLTEAELTAEQRPYYERMITRSRGRLQGPMNVLVRSPAFAEAMAAMDSFARSPSAGLDPRVRELAILINARFWDADYEWWVHVPKALELGVPRSAIEDIRAGRPPCDLIPEDHTIWEFLHTLMNERRVSDALYERAKAVMGETPLIHLIGFTGHYGLLGMILNATETHAPGVPDDELEILQPQ